MFQTFKISYSLKNTYFVNAFLYTLKQIPVIGKLIPQSIYGVDGLKILMHIMVFFKEVFTTFIGKLLYLLVMVIIPINMYQDRLPADYFVHILFFLTLVGALLNTGVFNPTKDKYYAVMLLRMDANRYAVAEYVYGSIKHLIGMLVFVMIFGLNHQVPFWICLIIPFCVVAAKAIYISWNLRAYEVKGICFNENHPRFFVWIITFLLVAAAYALPAVGMLLPCQFTAVGMILVIAVSIPFIGRIIHFQYYREMYQELLQERKLCMDVKTTSRNIQLKSSHNKISADTSITSGRHGFEYFNDLFMKRHRNALFRPGLVVAAGAFLLILVLYIVLRLVPELNDRINHIMLTMLP